jgi:hypothetical protein
MKANSKLVWPLFSTIVCGVAPAAIAQSAVVTLRLDATQIAVGETTTLHVYAQVVPNLSNNADRIFSWYVDLLNPNGNIADSTGAIKKTTADQDPQTSSIGSIDGANRRGVYDTFLNLPGAGVSTAVELFSVPIKGLAPGTAASHVVAGSGVPELGADFIVAPANGGVPLLGGDYSQAFAQLTVGTGGCQSQLLTSLQVLPNQTKQLVISFGVCSGTTPVVEFTDDLARPNWQTLQGTSGGSGMVTIPVGTSSRFFRVRFANAGGP